MVCHPDKKLSTENVTSNKAFKTHHFYINMGMVYIGVDTPPLIFGSLNGGFK